MEAEAKFKKVYMAYPATGDRSRSFVTLKDMDAITKIVKRCVDRTK